jgi:hypothetical protein
MYYPEPIGILMWLARGENPAPTYCSQEEVDAALKAAGLTMDTIANNVVEVNDDSENAAFQDDHDAALQKSHANFRAHVEELKGQGFACFYTTNIDGYNPWIATRRPIEGQEAFDPLASPQDGEPETTMNEGFEPVPAQLQHSQQVVLTWPDGQSGQGSVKTVGENSVVIQLDDDEYEFERGADGNYYEINNSSVPVNIVPASDPSESLMVDKLVSSLLEDELGS